MGELVRCVLSDCGLTLEAFAQGVENGSTAFAWSVISDTLDQIYRYLAKLAGCCHRALDFISSEWLAFRKMWSPDSQRQNCHFSPHLPYSPCHFMSLLVKTSIIATLLSAAKACSLMPSKSAKAALTVFPLSRSCFELLPSPPLLLPFISGGVFVLVDDFDADGGPTPAISTCVWEMNSRIPATRRFMSFMLVRLKFMWRGLEGLPNPLLSASPLPVVPPLICDVPFSPSWELLLRAGEMVVIGTWTGKSRSLVYWFLPTRPRFAGGRPVFFCTVLGGGLSRRAGAAKRALLVLAPLEDTVRESGGGEGSDSDNVRF